MKKLTATFDDAATVDLSSLLANAKEFRLETLPNNEPPPAKRTTHRIIGTTTGATVMEHFAASATFDQSQVGRWLEAKGYSRSGAAAVCSKLCKDGYIRALGAARYVFLKPINP